LGVHERSCKVDAKNPPRIMRQSLLVFIWLKINQPLKLNFD